MAVNNKRLRVTELDFDNIKDNLKTFLKAQSEFKRGRVASFSLPDWD